MARPSRVQVGLATIRLDARLDTRLDTRLNAPILLWGFHLLEKGEWAGATRRGLSPENRPASDSLGHVVTFA